MYSEEILKDQLDRIDMEKTEPQVLIKLIQDTIEKGASFSEKLYSLHDEVKKIEKIKQYIHKIKKNEIDQSQLISISAGLDGSTVNTGIRGITEYQCCSVANIIFENYCEKVTPYYDAKTIELKIDNPNRLESQMELNMMHEETNNIENAIIKMQKIPGQEKILFLDGPIIDPPNEKDMKYIQYRSTTINETFKFKLILIGVVKRFFENILLKSLLSLRVIDSNQIKLFQTDTIFTSILFADNSNEDDIALYTNYFEFDNISEIYLLYRSFGFRILCFFFRADLSSKICRIDFAVPFSNSKEQTDLLWIKIVHNLIKWTYNSQSYPLPVIMAHEKCTLRKVVSDYLFQEYISRSIRNNKKNIITFKGMGAE